MPSKDGYDTTNEINDNIHSVIDPISDPINQIKEENIHPVRDSIDKNYQIQYMGQSLSYALLMVGV